MEQVKRQHYALRTLGQHKTSTGILPRLKGRCSAKVVIADLDITGADKVVAEIEKTGGFVCSGPLSVSVGSLKRSFDLQDRKCDKMQRDELG